MRPVRLETFTPQVLAGILPKAGAAVTKERRAQPLAAGRGASGEGAGAQRRGTAGSRRWRGGSAGPRRRYRSSRPAEGPRKQAAPRLLSPPSRAPRAGARLGGSGGHGAGGCAGARSGGREEAPGMEGAGGESGGGFGKRCRLTCIVRPRLAGRAAVVVGLEVRAVLRVAHVGVGGQRAVVVGAGAAGVG